MEAKFYQIDAFSDRVFAGNPAGVCFLDERRSGFHRRAVAYLEGMIRVGMESTRRKQK